MSEIQLELLDKPKLLKLDFGCGKNPREGFDGVDVLDFGQKHKIDLNQNWPFDDQSVEEANASHFIEHLIPEERIHFVNELYRVLIPEGHCHIVVPYWGSARAYGDLTHKWPPVSEWWFYYLNPNWRAINAPHNIEYKCSFQWAGGYNPHPSLIGRTVEYQQFAIQFYKEAAQDIVGDLIKKKMGDVF